LEIGEVLGINYVCESNKKQEHMLGETYPLQEFDDATVFWFISTGEKGSITKVVLFAHKSGKVWNLGFGDYSDGAIHDDIVSNNKDIRKIMSTVAQAAYRFF
jgi:hypothetical protein